MKLGFSGTNLFENHRVTLAILLHDSSLKFQALRVIAWIKLVGGVFMFSKLRS